jgi:hypothetical protein
MKTPALAALLVVAGTAAAADDPDAPKHVHCLDLVRIKDTDIIDNRHIVFELTGGKRYLNTLPHACPGLGRNDPYLLRTSGHQICDLDIITILHSIGFGYTPGASCGLGPFEPVTEAQIEMLETAAKAKKD